jgi:hypothetical protein
MLYTRLLRYLSPSMCHLNIFLTLLAVGLSFGTSQAQLTKTLTGRLLSDDLEEVPMSEIRARDTTVIGRTDMEGYFKIDVPVSTNTLLFAAIGMERATINLSGECSNLEVILLHASSYDFMSVRRVNRQEGKRFKHLPQLHQQAYEKGLFKSRAPCASPIFTKWIPQPAKR